MAKEVADILLTPVRAWYSPVGTATPELVSGSALGTAAGATWPTGWVEMGYTNTPLSFEYVHEDADADIQESLAAVKRFRIKEELNIETTLAEFDSAQMAVAFSGSAISISGSLVNSEVMSVGGSMTLPELQWGFEGTYVDDTNGTTYPVRVYVHKATGVAGGKLEFGKKEAVGVPLKLKALADMSKAVHNRLFKTEKIVKKP
jgi:hypothetical protein